MKSDQYGEKGARKAKRDRYWSVMLVGDHGRIIPFRQFKGLAIGGICLLVISIVALIIISILFAHQKQKIDKLYTEVETVRRQAAQLRDEKDLYLTQLTVNQEQNSTTAKKPPPAKEPKKGAPPAVKPAAQSSKAVAKIKKEAPKPPPVAVKWAADIRRFKATYHPKQKVLKTEFRIYNTSKPKKTLSGRTVVVFKNLDDTPLHWFPVPRVQLNNGEPSGSRGQSFKLNNFRTVQFRAYGQKAPVRFNAATVFIYSDKGKLLVSKDFGFKIAYKPPAEPEKTKIPPKKKASPPTPSGTPAGSKESSGVPVLPSTTGGTPSALPDASKDAPAVSPTTDNVVKAADGAAASPDAAPPVNENNPPATGMAGDKTPSSSAPPVPPVDTPETDLNAKPQGEQQ